MVEFDARAHREDTVERLGGIGVEKRSHHLHLGASRREGLSRSFYAATDGRLRRLAVAYVQQQSDPAAAEPETEMLLVGDAFWGQTAIVSEVGPREHRQHQRDVAHRAGHGAGGPHRTGRQVRNTALRRLQRCASAVLKAVFQGFRVMPCAVLTPAPNMPKSGIVVLPNSSAPASLSRAAGGES